MVYQGLDVSQLQSTINWQAVAQAGYSFCFARNGIGNNGFDSNYTQNIAGMQAVGLKSGAYNFVFPLPTIPSQPLRDPKTQAQYHYAKTGNVLTSVDLEWPLQADWAKWGCSANQIVDWTLTYLIEYESLCGYKPLIYTYPYYMQSLSSATDISQFANYRLWVASYENSPEIPAPWTTYSVWQNGGGTVATLPGTNIKVDTDVCNDLSIFDLSSSQAAPQMTTPTIVSNSLIADVLAPVLSPMATITSTATPIAPSVQAPTPAAQPQIAPPNVVQPDLTTLIVETAEGLYTKYVKKT